MLEDSLRDMFSTRANSTPSVDDPAGTAIRRGQSIRRRQSAASALAAAVALVLTVGGMTSLGGWGRPGGRVAAPAAPLEGEPAPAAQASGAAPTRIATATPAAGPGNEPGIGLDLRVGNELWTVDGRRMALTGVGEVTRIYRVSAGWVYGGASGVRLIRPDGTSIPLSQGGERWVLSPDGGRLAVGAGAVLRVATVGPSGLMTPLSATVPSGTNPVAFFGNRLVISAPQGQPIGFDLLEPGRSHSPTWSTDITAVYGTHAKGLVGLVLRAGDNKPCLAELETSAGGLGTARIGPCTLGLRPDAVDGRLAPGGGWLAESSGKDLTLVDVTSALAGRAVTVNCGVRTSATPVWADSRTLVTVDERGVVRCRTDGSRQVVALPAGIGEDWQFVPNLTEPDPKPNPTPVTTTSR